jgi:MFS family permease
VNLVLFANGVAEPLSLELRLPLSILHFLEFAIWGAWFVVLGNYLNSLQFSRKDIGRIYATMSLGSVIAPMFVGTIADRYFASEHVMAVSQLIGAGLLFWMAKINTSRLFYWVALIYAIVYAPTLAIVNSIVFANVPDATRDFPTIRVLGTIGWIAAGMSLGLFIKSGEPMNNRPLLLAAGLSVVLGVFSFFLPHTPPRASGTGAQAQAVIGDDGKVVAIKVTAGGSGYQAPPSIGLLGGGGKKAAAKATISKDGAVDSIKVENGGSGYTSAPEVQFPSAEIPFLKAFELLKNPSFAIFFGVSFLITLALAFYYSWTALYLENAVDIAPQKVGPLMTIGQWVEIIFMFTLPWFLKELGMKWVLALGMAAWGLRYAIFAGKGLFEALKISPLPFILFGIGLHGICFDFFFAAGFIHVQNTAPSDIQASGQSLFAVLTYGLGMWLGTEASGWLNQWLTKEIPEPAWVGPVQSEAIMESSRREGIVDLTSKSRPEGLGDERKMIKVTDWTTFWLIPCAGVVVSLILFLLFFQG